MSSIDNIVTDITDDVKWIGVLDYDIETFDIVMTTDYGTTYNSYFIDADKKVIIDVAKAKFSDVYLNKLKSVTNHGEISYIVLNHTEPDHSGSLKLILDLAPDAVVVGSGNAIRYLEDIVNVPFKSLVVKDGDILDLGNKTLRFIAAPNLHWPDSIYTYAVEDKILFTCDSFGAHYCTSDIFSDFSNDHTKAYKYYFDVIMKPFSKYMLKAIDKINQLDLAYICPGHGPLHREHLSKAVALSKEYAECYLNISNDSKTRNILIAYVSAYGYTKSAAEHIAEGIRKQDNIEVDVVDIEHIDSSDLELKIIKSDGILVGSPTINQNTLLPVYRLFSLINPIRDRTKLGGAFGSYGWSGESPKIILENLRLLKLKIFEEPQLFKFSPEGSKGAELKSFGERFAIKFLEECS